MNTNFPVSVILAVSCKTVGRVLFSHFTRCHSSNDFMFHIIYYNKDCQNNYIYAEFGISGYHKCSHKTSVLKHTLDFSLSKMASVLNPKNKFINQSMPFDWHLANQMAPFIPHVTHIITFHSSFCQVLG